MAKLKAFAVRDSKAEAYLRPWFSETRGAAIRAFCDAVNDESSPFYTHCADYTLFEIGEYNQTNGTLLPAQSIVNCGNAGDFKTVQEAVDEVHISDIERRLRKLEKKGSD